MKIAEFSRFLEQIVAPMFSGATVEMTTEPSARASKSLVAYVWGGIKLRVKESQDSAAVFELRRGQAFDDSEKRLVEALVKTYAEIKAKGGDLVDELGDFIVR